MFVKNHYILIFVSILFLGLSAFSQDHYSEKCLTQVPENFSEIENQNRTTFQYYLDEYYNKFASKTSTAITNVPAKIHIVTDANGVTQITEDEIMDEIDEANSFLANSFLEITVCEDVNYIANNQLYFFDIDDQGLLYANNQPDIMNIYFVESIAFGNGNACGYTYLPGNSDQYYDVIVMDNQCTNNPVSTTLIHEFGHHFNLIHTHGDSNEPESTDELVNGSNCSTAGDRVCDTPADPLINGSNVSSVNCMYTGAATDAMGQFYDPDTSNIMSYSPNTCTDSISIEQYARMYAGFHTFKSYYKCPSFHIDFDADKNENCDDYMNVEFTDMSVGATAWEWDVDGDDIVDYTEQNPSHVYTPGIYDVALKIFSGSESITKVFPQFINFPSNLHETSKVNLELFIIDLNENTWEFKDGSGTILYSGGPYEDAGVFNHEFDVIQSECYTFTIYDSAGNGLGTSDYFFSNGTWNEGSEYYELTTEEGNLIYSNTNFGSEESKLISTNYLSLNQNNSNSISIYPNPAENYIKIRYQNIIPNSYEIYDTNGRLIKSSFIENDDSFSVDVSNFERGLYFISIKSEEKIDNLKFLVK